MYSRGRRTRQLRLSAGVVATVEVLALRPCRRPARVRTEESARVGDGRKSKSSGRARSPLRCPRGKLERIKLDLTVDDHHALLGARDAGRVPMADRLLALISLWRKDPGLNQTVSTRGQELLLAAGPGPDPSPAHEPPTQTVDPQVPPAS